MINKLKYIHTGWNIETTHLKTGRNNKTKILEVQLTYTSIVLTDLNDVTDNGTD
jgi:hypothetical protein